MIFPDIMQPQWYFGKLPQCISGPIHSMHGNLYYVHGRSRCVEQPFYTWRKHTNPRKHLTSLKRQWISQFFQVETDVLRTSWTIVQYMPCTDVKFWRCGDVRVWSSLSHWHQRHGNNSQVYVIYWCQFPTSNGRPVDIWTSIRFMPFTDVWSRHPGDILGDLGIVWACTCQLCCSILS